MATEITNPVEDESRDDEKQNYQYTSTSSPSFHELTGFQRDVLYVLKNQDDPIKGLSVKEKLEAYYEKEVNTGQLYPNLNTLVEMGLVEKGEMDQRTNAYEITSNGKILLANRREWESGE